jgi:hypothetical protein
MFKHSNPKQNINIKYYTKNIDGRIAIIST